MRVLWKLCAGLTGQETLPSPQHHFYCCSQCTDLPDSWYFLVPPSTTSTTTTNYSNTVHCLKGGASYVWKQTNWFLLPVTWDATLWIKDFLRQTIKFHQNIRGCESILKITVTSAEGWRWQNCWHLNFHFPREEMKNQPPTLCLALGITQILIWTRLPLLTYSTYIIYVLLYYICK